MHASENCLLCPKLCFLKPGDTLILRRAGEIGRPAVYDKTGQLLAPAEISVSLPQVLDHAKVGEPIWFDDGKIGGVFREVKPDGASVEITQARPEGEKLAAEKGINLPQTRIHIAALTSDDMEALKFIVKHADMAVTRLSAPIPMCGNCWSSLRNCAGNTWD